MSRFVQWFCGLAAVGTLGYAAFIASIILPNMLVTAWKAGAFLPLIAVPSVFGIAWFGLWQYRGRPGRLRTGAVVVGVVAVLVVGASTWFHVVGGGGVTQEVEVTPSPQGEPQVGSRSDAPDAPPPPASTPLP